MKKGVSSVAFFLAIILMNLVSADVIQDLKGTLNFSSFILLVVFAFLTVFIKLSLGKVMPSKPAGVIAFAASLFIVFQISNTNLSFESFFGNFGIQRGLLIPIIILIGFVLFIVILKKGWMRAILRTFAVALIVIAYFGDWYNKWVAIFIAVIILILTFLGKRRPKTLEEYLKQLYKKNLPPEEKRRRIMKAMKKFGKGVGTAGGHLWGKRKNIPWRFRKKMQKSGRRPSSKNHPDADDYYSRDTRDKKEESFEEAFLGKEEQKRQEKEEERIIEEMRDLRKPYLRILGLGPNASDKEIQDAYRKLAKKYHPDNPETGNPSRFREVQEAYEFLMNTPRATKENVRSYTQVGQRKLLANPSFRTKAKYFMKDRWSKHKNRYKQNWKNTKRDVKKYLKKGRLGKRQRQLDIAKKRLKDF